MEFLSGLGGIWVILLFLTALAVYLLPFLIAKKESPVIAVFLLNLLFGWTLLGWIGALILGQTGDKKQKTIINQPEPDKYDKLAKLKHLLDNGAISDSEYNTEKQKILSGLNTEWQVKK